MELMMMAVAVAVVMRITKKENNDDGSKMHSYCNATVPGLALIKTTEFGGGTNKNNRNSIERDSNDNKRNGSNRIS